jgi:hypothetical protein
MKAHRISDGGVPDLANSFLVSFEWKKKEERLFGRWLFYRCEEAV